MLFYSTECPHCGNEITVSNARETQKCLWCRRLISVKIERTGKKKIKCEVEPVDFSDNQKQNFSQRKDNISHGV